MKKLIALFLCLCLTAGILPALAESAPAFTVQSTPVSDGSSDVSSMDLRFYADAPNIAYAGIKAYIAEGLELNVTVTAQEDGTWIIANPNGKTLVADPTAGTILADDWAAFMTPDPPYIGKIAGIKDTSCEWTQLLDIVYDDEPTPVTFDFAKYGIAMYADEADVYLPLAIIGAMMENVSANLIAYNGEKLYKFNGQNGSLAAFVPGYYEGEKIKAFIKGEAQRAEDQIRESYAELCFIMDYFYGYPGVKTDFEASLREKGLDAAIDDLPDGWGEKIRQQLGSADYFDYMLGLYSLLSIGFGDGHTTLDTAGALSLIPDFQDVFARFQPLLTEPGAYTMETYQGQVKSFPLGERQELWGDETYHEFGSTAVITIDAFAPDMEAWLAWQEGKGEMPMDALGITCRGLEKAAANPAIKNIIFDLTLNSGGSQDLTMSILGMVTGDVVFSGYNTLTKQKIHANVITDRNMDGVIDEKDKDVSYDYNFGVLTTRSAFSCGNLFPILMQEKGAAVLGENTGGGSCVVNLVNLSDGAFFQLSSYQWHLLNSKGEDVVEKGADPDIPIERTEITEWQNVHCPRMVPGNYETYYNGELLDQLMNEYFAQKEEPAA